MAKCNVMCLFVNFIVFLCTIDVVMGQEPTCLGAGSIAASVIITLLVVALLAVLLYFVWNKFWKNRKGQHLILETDPERGKGEYAFDNPGFKDAGTTPVTKSLEKSKSESNNKTKWNQWSPLGVLSTKNEKKRTLDDSAIEDLEKIVSLRSHDFTGLGFNICGNMKDGIFIKDVLHRGPAFESGKLNPGDRINSVTISFEHMVYEDALAILSYASPYKVIISAKQGKPVNYPGQSGTPGHPIYRSSSSADISHVEKTSKKRLFQPDDSSDIGSNYSSLQKTRSNVTTLERNKDKSPKTNQKLIKPKTKLNPEQLKVQLEQNIIEDYKETMRMKKDLEQPKQEAEAQKSENKHHKFGVQVFPMENIEQKSPKHSELSQNDNNINFEQAVAMSIDEVDKKVAPPVKKREKVIKTEIHETETFTRDLILNGSGIKRDSNNIPLEIPDNMFNAAVAARKNRKSIEEEEIKSPKKLKGKAPPPPESLMDIKGEDDDEHCKFDEIYPVDENDTKVLITSKTLNKSDDSIEKMNPEISKLSQDIKDYNSDSDIETDNQSSVNTIELNASDITIHQSEESEEKQNRKTASTGDLTKIQKTRKTSSGTLERAQSLDITDTTIPSLTKKRKAGKIEDNFDSKTSSDDSLYGNALVNKEPRLSLILDGLNTFQRNRLKKSTEWGNLEDAILNFDKQDGSIESLERHNSSFEDIKLSSENLAKSFNFGTKSPEFDALVNKINEIKQETIEIINEQDRNTNKPIEPEITNEEMKEIIEDVPKTMQTMSKTIEEMPKSIESITIETIATEDSDKKIKNKIWPFDESKVESNHFEVPKKSEKFEIIFNKPKFFKHEEVQLNINANKPDDAINKTSDDAKITSLEHQPPVETVEVILDKTVHKIDIKSEPENKSIPQIQSVSSRPHQPINLAQVNNFIVAEREASCKYFSDSPVKMDDTNVSDDIKVSRHSMGSLERPKFNLKSNDNSENISNITISDKDVETFNFIPAYEVSINENVPIKSIEKKTDIHINDTGRKTYDNVIVSTPDLIKNITIAEAIHDLNNEVTIEGPTSLTFEIPAGNIEVKDSKIMESTGLKYNDKDFNTQNGIQMKTNGDINKLEVPGESEKNNSSLTYITEIQVLTPNNKNKNISEIEIIPKEETITIEKTNNKNLDNAFENYIKNFESNIKNFENNINTFDQNIQDVTVIAKKEPSNTRSIIINEKVDPEKELLKVQERVEEQLKKLPEMRFTTSSYESQIKPPEKRQSQIEILRSNFEKSTSPPKLTKTEPSPTKSRIPVLNKTPPTSPERRDSKILDTEPNKEILEMMSSHIPMTSSLKYQPKSNSRNVTVTSIRSNSKIPSGLPTYSSRPPVPPRKIEHEDHHIQVSTNGSSENFRQWVFNPSDSSVTNITVTEAKYDNK